MASRVQPTERRCERPPITVIADASDRLVMAVEFDQDNKPRAVALTLSCDDHEHGPDRDCSMHLDVEGHCVVIMWRPT